MDADVKKNQGNPNPKAANRRHGSTTFFVMVDYLFLCVFICFLCYFLLKIWPGSALIHS